MYEIRFHGRGGQGARMAAEAFALAAFLEGKYAVSFPFFGAERRGAPVRAFTRVDENKIRIKTQVYEPDYVVVLDETLVETEDVLEGLKKDGMVIINTSRKPEEVKLSREVKCATVDATSIALEILGRPITNTSILGAIAKATGKVSIESIEKAIIEKFGGKLGEEAGKRNAEAARVAYEKTLIGKSKAGKEFIPRRKWLPGVDEMPVGGATSSLVTEAGLVGIGSFVENKTGDWRTFMPVIDEEKCIGCQFCWFYCPEGCIKMENKKAKVDYEYCKGCGICANECPAKAISMQREVRA
ncbi:MAG: pyruvate ferredoxin oxidoreductase subunit gamma [Thermoplasmatales archaeon]|nr:pyruvate ferredoxin oxidoreductase subunit gamma [Thermoplasmatales archaeon]